MTLNLRPYQTAAVESLRESLRSGMKRLMLSSPTGSGKTEIGMEVIRGAIAKSRRVVFLCNRIHLVEQTSRRLTNAGIEHGVIQSINSRAEYRPVIVASIQTVAKRGMPETDLVVIDEAHAVAGSSEFRKIITQRPGTPVVGLSATPWSRGLARVYQELGGPLFQELVTAITIPELIEQGYLVDADVYAPSEPDLSGVKTVAGDYHEGQLGEAVNKPELIGDIVQNWLKLAGGEPTVCFATNIAHSKEIVRQFVQVGVTADHIDCFTKDDERRGILARITSGETKIISNVGILTEGWDFPACRVLILARPTKSLIRYIQMAGRVLRTCEGKEKATIIDHSGTCKRLGFPTDHISRPLDDGKPKASSGAEKKAKEESLPKACPSCHFMKAPKVHKCPACGFTPERPSKMEVIDGELSLIKRSKKHQPVKDLAERFGTKQEVWSMLQSIAARDGWSDGRTAHTYRDIFGVWPRGLSDSRATPSEELVRWLRSRLIKWAKSQCRTKSSSVESMQSASQAGGSTSEAA